MSYPVLCSQDECVGATTEFSNTQILPRKAANSINCGFSISECGTLSANDCWSLKMLYSRVLGTAPSRSLDNVYPACHDWLRDPNTLTDLLKPSTAQNILYHAKNRTSSPIPSNTQGHWMLVEPRSNELTIGSENIVSSLCVNT